MPRFRFSLETVLKQRKNIEHIAQREAAIARQSLVDLQASLQKLDRDVKAVGEDMRQNHLVGTISIGILTAHRRYSLAMERTALSLVRSIAVAQGKVDQTRAALMTAAREHKVIQTLKEKQFAEWAESEQRRENADLDEAGMQIAFGNLTETSRQSELES